MQNHLINAPIFRHSDLKVIGNKIKIIKTKNFYSNESLAVKQNSKEFKSKKYALLNQDYKLFFDENKKKYFKRSEVLTSIIKKKIKNKKSKILDFGCNKGFLLSNLSKFKYKNLYGYDLGKYFKKFFQKKNIIFLEDFLDKKNFFDLIIFSHTLSYSQNIFKSMKLVKKILKKNGIIFFNLQNIEKRPSNIFFGDQKYHFNKNMIKNFFSNYGKVSFINNSSLSHEFLFFVQTSNKIKKKLKKVNFLEINKAEKILYKIKKIRNESNVLGTNLNSALIVNILKKKIKNIVLEKKTYFKNFLNIKIINLKEHKKKDIPLIVSFGKENSSIIKRLHKKYNLKKIISI